MLAGCDSVGGLPGARPPETVWVAGRSVVIGGPEGYCVDRADSRLNGDSPFVLLGSCASIAGDRAAGAPAFPGVLTAAVSPPGDGAPFADTIAQLDAFVGSEAGRAALARDGDPASVQVLATERVGEALVIHLRDTSDNAVPGIEETYWRGLFEVNGRLVTVSVMSFADLPLGRDAGRATMTEFIGRIRRESAAGGAV